VDHRHLLPDEIDLLVDGEEGFGVAPLAAHMEQCADCRARIESHRQLVASLEHLPHLNPGPLFTYRVMSRVQVFEPWYVSALDTVRPFVPRSRSARVFAGATAALVATFLTAFTLLVATRMEWFAFLVNVGARRVQGGANALVGSAISSMFGDAAAANLLSSGGSAIVIVLTTLLASVVVSALALRAVTSASRRRRM
jgi:hypothetical protein